MPVQGYKVRLRKSGDSTAMSAEATTSLGSNRYQITSAARRCVNPDVSWSVRDGSTTLAYSGIVTVQWEFGIFTLASAPGGAVTVNGAYLPLTTTSEDVAEGREFTLSEMDDLTDSTVFGMAYRARHPTLRDAQVSIGVISSPAAYSAAYSDYRAGRRICLEIDPDRDTAGEVWRGFGKLESVERSGEVSGLIESTIVFKLDASKNAEGFHPALAWG